EDAPRAQGEGNGPRCRVLLRRRDLEDPVARIGGPAPHPALAQLLAGIDHGKTPIARATGDEHRRARDTEEAERAVRLHLPPLTDGEADAAEPVELAAVRVAGQRGIEDAALLERTTDPLLSQLAVDHQAALHLEIGGDPSHPDRGIDVVADVEV